MHNRHFGFVSDLPLRAGARSKLSEKVLRSEVRWFRAVAMAIDRQSVMNFAKILAGALPLLKSRPTRSESVKTAAMIRPYQMRLLTT